MDHSSGCSIMSISNFVQWRKNVMRKLFQLPDFALLCDFPRRASWGEPRIEEEFQKLSSVGFNFGLLAILWMAEWEFLIEFFSTFYEVSRNGRENNKHSIENSGNSMESSVD